jgi:hypothetical protein
LNTSPSEFAKNLEDSGFTKDLSKDGKVVNYMKGDAKYTIRQVSKSRGPTADRYVEGRQVEEIRFLKKD